MFKNFCFVTLKNLAIINALKNRYKMSIKYKPPTIKSWSKRPDGEDELERSKS